MKELTNLPSATIHRHLGLNSEDDFKTLEDYLDCALIIIDEFSMVDTWLANQLFESIADSTQVIIVGDQDQLPSVGPGQVLANLLQINEIPKVSLTKIFRQSEDSTIVTLDLLNPQEKANQFAFNDICFRKNDKILHLVNDTELNVFNGDIGIITDLIPGKYTESKQDEIYMSFDGNEVIYPRNEWNKITLAYAMSIHKSQGSEFPVVILPITRQSGRMLQRNLIYTAITRAKSKLVMLGEIAAFDYAVHNEGAKRNTYLIQRFEQTYTQAVDKSVNKPVQTEENYRLTEDNWSTIDPMIGLSEDDIAAFFNNN